MQTGQCSRRTYCDLLRELRAEYARPDSLTVHETVRGDEREARPAQTASLLCRQAPYIGPTSRPSRTPAKRLTTKRFFRRRSPQTNRATKNG